LLQDIDDKANSIIGVSLSHSKLHQVDLDKSFKEIWEDLNKLFGAKVVNAIIFKFVVVNLQCQHNKPSS